jgi:hypothetical protein
VEVILHKIIDLIEVKAMVVVAEMLENKEEQDSTLVKLQEIYLLE